MRERVAMRVEVKSDRGEVSRKETQLHRPSVVVVSGLPSTLQGHFRGDSFYFPGNGLTPITFALGLRAVAVSLASRYELA